MRSSIIWLAVVSAILSCASSAGHAEPPGELRLRDDFDGKSTLVWQTIRPDPTHLSLTKHPGKLTITTQYGSIHGTQTTAKNLHFISVPEELGDFVATTCIEQFLPETEWQQAGLLFYDDDDNYLKWVRDFAGQGYPVLNAFWETGDERKGTPCPVEVPKQRFWLRVIKRGDLYQCMASLDGERFTTYAVIPRGDGTPEKVGLVAKNGPREGDLEARFDFFELRELTEEERNDPAFAARRALLGSWRAVERKAGGRSITKGPATRLLVEPGALTLQEQRKLIVSFTVNPTVTPHHITFIPRQFGVGHLLNGVYLQDGDRLTICLNSKVNGERPKNLESNENDGYLFLRMERSE